MEPYRPNCYKIPELNGLRVLLVFIVSWYHFWQQSWLTPSIGSYSLDYLLRAGYMPVDGTILLSGFLLFLPYARAMLLGEAVPNTKQFYQRRIMRIVPSYYFVTLALLFAVALDEGGCSEAYYRMLSRLRRSTDLLSNSIGACIVTGVGEFYTKDVAREMYEIISE